MRKAAALELDGAQPEKLMKLAQSETTSFRVDRQGK